ncbi:hypothetical protein GGS21DRAFT_523332 [Xylaria nigripes]|nr:hypothetical protein GGS21DRAFT_523332 [Xylaria nigripes]
MSDSNDTELFRGIDKTDFFIISNKKEMLRMVLDQFSDEFERLVRADPIPNDNASSPSTPSPSKILFGSDFNEVNRTLTSVIALRWIYTGDYAIFRKSQPADSALTWDSFFWMRFALRAWVETNDDFFALLTFIMVKNLGKDSQLAADYYSKIGEDISSNNHNLILLRAAEIGLVPCLSHLPLDYKQDVMRGLKLGAHFNFAQLARGENAPVSLSAFLKLRNHQRAFQFYFMEQLLEVAGAGGHEDWTCAVRLTQPVFDAYRDVYDAAQCVVSKWIGLREAFDYVLIRRSLMLLEKGFRRLDICDKEDRALMRLLCMGNVTDLSTAELYESVWEELEMESKASLVADLNINGSVDVPAVLPTYASELLTNGVGTDSQESSDDKWERLWYLLRYLARVLRQTDKPVNGKVVVIERNLQKISQVIVTSEEFRINPAMLESLEIPTGTVAQSV